MNNIETGMHVKIVRLYSTSGFLIKEKHLSCRKIGTCGIIKRYVPGHGGDVWFVQHDNSEAIGAYGIDEMELCNEKGEVIVDPPYKKFDTIFESWELHKQIKDPELQVDIKNAIEEAYKLGKEDAYNDCPH